MGAWGSGLYANDSTVDVRDTYLGFLKEQLNSQEAYEKTLEKCREYIGDQDEPLFWYALADTQWKVGRLSPEVKTKALEWIANNGGIELWEENKSSGASWKKSLEKLKEKLESPMPPKKKIRKPEEINQNPWTLNDVYAYRFNTEKSKEYGVYGKHILIQKIGEGQDYSPFIKMRVHLFDRLFDTVPDVDEIKGLRIMPLDFPTSTRDLHMNTLMIVWKRNKEYPSEHLFYVGNIPAPANKILPRWQHTNLDWIGIDDWAAKYHSLWRGIEYETVEDGIFRYTHLE